jgi:ankyrin repeat protein
MYGHSETVRVFLERGADANFRDNDGHTLIHNACSDDYSRSDSLVRLLLEQGADPNARDNKRQTPLHLLALSYLDSSTKLGFARILLVHGADVDAEDEGEGPHCKSHWRGEEQR